MQDELDLSNFQRLVVVSNRLPISIHGDEEHPQISPSSGGLITALSPLLRNKKGLWIGWSGATTYENSKIDALIDTFQKEVGFSLHQVPLTKEEVSNYYEGFSNEIIWPLFHDLQFQCNFSPAFWEGYKRVNEKFATHVLSLVKPDDFVWIQDYHLILLAKDLRQVGFHSKLAFFLHIPFAPLDIFLKIPWRFEILRSLLEYDFIGFQTLRDQRNFIQCVRALLKDIKVGSWRNQTLLQVGGREVRVGAYPISIDYQQFAKTAAIPAVTKAVEEIVRTKGPLKIVFSVDRLDYTKGIPYRLNGIAYFLEHHPEMHEKVRFVQVVVPSRTGIKEYDLLKDQIDRLVGEINSRFTKSGWVPIHYMFHSLSNEELLAYYRLADVALVTPVKDGMNLVSKEYCAANIDETGVLVLSEFAGAATQLKEFALLINPYDVVGLGNAIYTALKMPATERRERMHKMRLHIKANDIYRWVNNIVKGTYPELHEDSTLIEEYTPTEG